MSASLTLRCEICAFVGEPRTWSGARDHVTGDVFHLSQCRRCGFARTEPAPDSLERYYERSYRRFGRAAAGVLRRFYVRRISGWQRDLGAPGIAVEVGSGTGWMLGALRERGWRAFGSERTLEAAALARGGARSPVFVGDLSAIREAPVLDLVIMFHVLEHLADPLAALRQTAARLRPGGMLVLGLPNLGSWQARYAGTRWLHLDVPRHLCHFTPDSIERALALSGLRLVRVGFRSFEHDPPGWVQAFLDRLGYGPGSVLKLLTRSGARVSIGASLALLLLLPLLGACGLVLALVSWPARAGAVMEVWATRDR